MNSHDSTNFILDVPEFIKNDKFGVKLMSTQINIKVFHEYDKKHNTLTDSIIDYLSETYAESTILDLDEELDVEKEYERSFLKAYNFLQNNRNEFEGFVSQLDATVRNLFLQERNAEIKFVKLGREYVCCVSKPGIPNRNLPA